MLSKGTKWREISWTEVENVGANYRRGKGHLRVLCVIVSSSPDSTNAMCGRRVTASRTNSHEALLSTCQVVPNQFAKTSSRKWHPEGAPGNHCPACAVPVPYRYCTMLCMYSGVQ